MKYRLFCKICLPFFIIFCFCAYGAAYAQKENPGPGEVIDKYLKAIGGVQKWENLSSRKSVEKLDIYNFEGLITGIDKTLYYTKYFQAPVNYLSLWFEDIYYNILAYNVECVWIYSDLRMSVGFLDKKYIKKNTRFPQVGILEILNFPLSSNTVEIVENTYKIDFNDKFWNRTMSVYFDKESFLVVKHEYVNPGGGHHQYLYKDYRSKHGFTEPYKIENFVDYKIFKTQRIDSIEYNLAIHPGLFIPPVECPLGSEKSNVILEEKPPFIYE